jgi:cobalt/nickel transport system ATP-binding protein
MDKNNLLIKLERVSYAYPGGGPVLKDLFFELREKERIGLIGPNGSGKTTLFHLIMGLLRPVSGQIEIFGQPMRDEKDFRPVLEDVAFGPLNQGKGVEEAKTIAKDTLHSLGLEGLDNRITHKLSGGEKKLVSLATVLAMKPHVLLLDEPTTGLHSETTERIIGILKDIDISYVFISHNMDFIAQTTHKIYGMVDGQIFLEEERIPHTHAHAHGYGKVLHTHSNHNSTPPDSKKP